MSFYSELGHLLAFVMALAEVVFASLIALRILRIQGVISSVLAVAILNCAQIVVAVEILSLLNSITLWHLVVLHTGVCVILLAVKLRAHSLLFVAPTLWHELTQ